MDETDNSFLTVPPQMVRFQVLEYANRYSTTAHVPTTHELMYVLDGKLTLHLGEHLVFQAMPGDFLFVESGVRHRDEFAVLRGLRIMLLQFSWPNQEFFRIINNHSLLNLSYNVRSEVWRRLDFMRSNWDDTPECLHHASIELHGILLLFYFDLRKNGRRVEPPPLQPQTEAMRRAKHFLEQNYAKPLNLEQTARHIGLSPAYFSRSFHREYGMSFSKYLTSLRLEAAHRLLQTTRLQIGEVASRCGFSSSSYFIKVFSEHYRVTPKDMQKNSSPRKFLQPGL